MTARFNALIVVMVHCGARAPQHVRLQYDGIEARHVCAIASSPVEAVNNATASNSLFVVLMGFISRLGTGLLRG